jgi:hypothetical protein
MKNSTRKDRYRRYAIEALAWHLRCGSKFDAIGHDGRAGSCDGNASLAYSIGGTYTTTPNNPARNIIIKSELGKKLASFSLEELREEAMAAARIQ